MTWNRLNIETELKKLKSAVNSQIIERETLLFPKISMYTRSIEYVPADN